MTITYAWRGDFEDAAVDALHGEAFGHAPTGTEWGARVRGHSLGWVCAHRDGRLVGFVNVVWDGGAHAFLLDTMVASDARGRGVGTELVAVAAEEARSAGCHWLHVDFEERLRPFYFEACEFRPTDAGLIALR
ncbi:GNAT family N-acetyltransferase [Streptomyces sp. SS1-1]|uniref:GNAT family N-acetyltransferase n=1 Tax=Streptomyces sp. SS1-1 TaxID=2651869 RepID=UPI00124FB59E|nr:GNAT family N-acetyltransferase [Streptomyces sp. SS1-1]KAB2974289.1 GNAT family N-acetyltransferase [Streptomyces sp. SS1-1]